MRVSGYAFSYWSYPMVDAYVGSFVPPFAAVARHAITGWFRDR